MEHPCEPAGDEQAAGPSTGARPAAVEAGERPPGGAPEVARIHASAVRYAVALREAMDREADRLLEVAGRRAEALRAAAEAEAARVTADADRRARSLLAEAAVDAEDLNRGASGARENCDTARGRAENLARRAVDEALSGRLAAAADALEIRSGAEEKATALLATAADGLHSAQEARRSALRSAAEIRAAAVATACRLTAGPEESLAAARRQGVRAERETAQIVVATLRRSAGQLAAARQELAGAGTPDTAEPDTAEPGLGEPGIAEPDLDEPGIGEPDLDEPVVSRDEEKPAGGPHGPSAAARLGLTADRVLVYSLLILLGAGPAAGLLVWWLTHG